MIHDRGEGERYHIQPADLMLIRAKLQIGYLDIFILAVCIGLAMIWAVRTWQAAAWTESLCSGARGAA